MRSLLSKAFGGQRGLLPDVALAQETRFKVEAATAPGCPGDTDRQRSPDGGRAHASEAQVGFSWDGGLVSKVHFRVLW